MSFWELCFLVIVAIVVIGPKELPRYLRKAGQFSAKIRRMATDVRAQSGIDEVLRTEGLTKDIAEIRRLTSGDFLRPSLSAVAGLPASTSDGVHVAGTAAAEPSRANEITIVREREYPREGADAYGAIPDTAIVYARGLPASALARDALYVVGDAGAPLPPVEPEPEPQPTSDEPLPENAPEVEASPDPAPDVGRA
jgi:sec-independent protein translocase protein TatB